MVNLKYIINFAIQHIFSTGNSKNQTIEMNNLTKTYNMSRSFSLVLLLTLTFLYACPAWGEETDVSLSSQVKPTNEERVYARTGHYVGGYLGYSHMASVGKVNWTKGSPWDGIGWQVDYTWIPSKHCDYKIFNVPCAVGLGALYSGYRAGGNDYFDLDRKPGNADMSLMLNYLAIEATLKLLSRSDRWEFNIRYGMGLVLSIFHGTAHYTSAALDPLSFSTTKCGYGMSFRFSAQYNLSKKVALYISFTGIEGNIQSILYNSSFPVYNDYNTVDGYKTRNRWFVNQNLSLGATYHFGPGSH